jgi:16S rRNA (guanine527-N7)-methyltransferase
VDKLGMTPTMVTEEPLTLGLPKGEGLVFDAATFAAAAGASSGQMADLERFRDLLAEANVQMNLVGPSALAEFWPRHAWDSAQLLRVAADLQGPALTWADLGAGAGFPGLVLAILLKGRAGGHVQLVESTAKRCGFLRRVTHELQLPATVHNARAEALRLAVDCVTARACAPMPRLLQFARPYLSAGAVGLFLKGRGVEAELAEARKTWRFEAELCPSLSDPTGRIVVVKGAPKPYGR